MYFNSNNPDISEFSDDLLEALRHDASAASRIFATLERWLGAQPWQTWLTFLEAHPPNADQTDPESPLRPRALMVAKRIPTSLAPTAPRPWPRLITASEQWIHTHTRKAIECTVQRQFFWWAPRLVDFRPEQIHEFRNEAVQDSWQAFFDAGCASWDLRQASLRTWARRIACFRTIDYLRRLTRSTAGRCTHLDPDLDLPAPTDRLNAAGINPWDLARFADALNPYQRDLFELYFVEGFSGAEIGMRLGKTTSAVHRMLFVVADKLKNFFDSKPPRGELL